MYGNLISLIDDAVSYVLRFSLSSNKYRSSIHLQRNGRAAQPSQFAAPRVKK